MNGHWGKLPSNSARVIWEVEAKFNDHPPFVKCVKPKLWIVGKLRMETGKVYVLS